MRWPDHPEHGKVGIDVLVGANEGERCNGIDEAQRS